MTLFDRVADLPLVVEESSRERHERDTSSGFLRKSTTFLLRGEAATGRGEDVTYDAEDHDALADAPTDLVSEWGLDGEWTFGEFSGALDEGIEDGEVDLFPTKPPEREASRHYRRWAVESAALDLALRQSDRSLGETLEREYAPVRFVASTRLGDPPTTDRVEAIRERVPDIEFKLDPTPDWTDDLVADLAETGAVRVLDLKGRYEGTEVDNPADPDLYRRVFEGFPDAVVEDPGVSDEVAALVEEHGGRVSWDYPITGVESVEELPFEPNWLNVKPSRFGTVESLFETVEWADERGVSLYGGGQFELAVGRDQIQALASLLYPDGPNDVAPGVYNDPDVPAELPASPLPAPAGEPGFGN
ncbi:hypothetical protein ACFO0N_05745 [Halobium salinum]|uniref:L-alanine-DL-glutamate epimerase n=1 Tax=Halobium salinum TaxID=1364940 RepID=A0ABD5P998_9EURY|nr:hypothetical protein [Halobium salinum]